MEDRCAKFDLDYERTEKGESHIKKALEWFSIAELRFDADDGVWRVAFALGPAREAVLLVAGDKSGGGEKRFYKRLIRSFNNDTNQLGYLSIIEWSESEAINIIYDMIRRFSRRSIL